MGTCTFPSVREKWLGIIFYSRKMEREESPATPFCISERTPIVYLKNKITDLEMSYIS